MLVVCGGGFANLSIAEVYSNDKEQVECGPACAAATRCLCCKCSCCSFCSATCITCPANPNKSPNGELSSVLGLDHRFNDLQ